MAEPINTANDALKLMELKEMVRKRIQRLMFDGPDTAYQQGYLDAFRAILKEMEKDRG